MYFFQNKQTEKSAKPLRIDPKKQFELAEAWRKNMCESVRKMLFALIGGHVRTR